MKKHTKNVTGVAASPCGLLASSAEDGKLFLFDRNDPQVEFELLGDKSERMSHASSRAGGQRAAEH